MCMEEQEEHYKMTSRGVLMYISDQTVIVRLYGSGMRVVPVFTDQHHASRLPFARQHQSWKAHHWHSVVFTDESRFIPSTCDRCERVWRHHGDWYAACSTVQHDRFGSGAVVIYGGRSWEGLYVLANSNPTAVGYWDKIFRPIVRPYAGAMSPGFLLCWTMLGLVWLKCPGWWGHWYHCLALTFLKDLNPIYSLRDFMHCCQITPQTVQEPWSRSGRRSPSKPSTVSSEAWPDVGSTYGQMGAIHTNEPDYEACWIRL